jgi:hypothetical protein
MVLLIAWSRPTDRHGKKIGADKVSASLPLLAEG